MSNIWGGVGGCVGGALSFLVFGRKYGYMSGVFESIDYDRRTNERMDLRYINKVKFNMYSV